MIIALMAATLLMAESATALQVAPAAPAASVEAPAATAPGARPAKAKGQTLICRNEPTLGTRLPTKRCRTAADIAEQQRDSRSTLEKLQQVTPETIH